MFRKNLDKVIGLTKGKADQAESKLIVNKKKQNDSKGKFKFL